MPSNVWNAGDVKHRLWRCQAHSSASTATRNSVRCAARMAVAPAVGAASVHGGTGRPTAAYARAQGYSKLQQMHEPDGRHPGRQGTIGPAVRRQSGRRPHDVDPPPQFGEVARLDRRLPGNDRDVRQFLPGFAVTIVLLGRQPRFRHDSDCQCEGCGRKTDRLRPDQVTTRCDDTADPGPGSFIRVPDQLFETAAIEKTQERAQGRRPELYRPRGPCRSIRSSIVGPRRMRGSKPL